MRRKKEEERERGRKGKVGGGKERKEGRRVEGKEDVREKRGCERGRGKRRDDEREQIGKMREEWEKK